MEHVDESGETSVTFCIELVISLQLLHTTYYTTYSILHTTYYSLLLLYYYSYLISLWTKYKVTPLLLRTSFCCTRQGSTGTSPNPA